MRILISNDDGVHAPGIHALFKEFSLSDQVVIVAPERERSTTGHSLTLHKPLRLHKFSSRIYSVSGGPADCIYVAVNEVFRGKKPDLVISGINRGANLGQDVFYSGTVSAAREAANLGIPAMAVSLDLNLSRKIKETHYSTAAKATRDILKVALPLFGEGKRKDGFKKWPQGIVLNVNVPNLPYKKLKGIRPASQGFQLYSSEVLRRKDSRGRDYFWIGGTYKGYKPIPKTDCWVVDHGYVSLTPLELDTTMKEVYHSLQEAFGVKGNSP